MNTPKTSRLLPADDLLLPAVHETIKHLQLRPEDSAAATLAERYAAEIDANETDAALEKLGPKLLACLVELGATPKARSAKGGERTRAESRLAAIREARRSA